MILSEFTDARGADLLPLPALSGRQPYERQAQMKIMIVDYNTQMRRMIVSLIDDLAEEIIECRCAPGVLFQPGERPILLTY